MFCNWILRDPNFTALFIQFKVIAFSLFFSVVWGPIIVKMGLICHSANSKSCFTGTFHVFVINKCCSFLCARLKDGTYYGIPMSDCPFVCPSVRPFHMSRSNLRTPWPIHFKFHRVIGIDSLTVCILYGEISNFHSRVMGLYSSNCMWF